MHTPPAFAARHLSLCVLAAATSLPALAQRPPEGGEPPSSSWGLGLGVASSKNAYTGFKRDSTVVPFLQFENEHVKVFGPGVEVKLPGLRISESQRIHFGLVGQYDLSSGYEAKDSVVFAGMAERKAGIWVGAKAEWETSLLNVTAELMGDASGDSKGKTFSLGVERSWHFGQNWMLTPRVVAKWQDRKYVDYYYGVRAGEARAGRAAYRGDSGVSAEVGLRGVYMFDQQHSVFLDVGVTRLSSSIKNSPLVDRSTENNLFLGYVYRFR